jgi:hypothetical protein
MRIFLFFVILFFLISCASTQPKVDFNNKRIGVHYLIKDDLKLCHSHTGFTIFQNKSEEFPVTENFNDIVSNGYIKGINETRNMAVPIKSNTNWAQYLTYSGWDATPTLSTLGKQKLNKISINNNLDYIVIARDYKNFFKGQVCSGSWFKTDIHGVNNFVPLYVALVFDSINGKYIGTTFINNKKHVEAYAQISNPKELNTNDISELAKYSEKAAYKAIKTFINEN